MITSKNYNSKKLLIIIFSLSFVVFLFTSDGHRYTIDEALGQEMAYRITTLEPDPSYVQGVSKSFFHIPIMNPYNVGLLCSNGLTCYPTSVFYSITQVPFIAINHYFQIITYDTLILTPQDFTDQHYIFWRNSEKSDLVFMELFYGPFFSALSVSVFFLICLEYNFTRYTSVILSLLFSFTTIVWAYSNTSLNVVPTLFFILAGYLFYKKSQINSELKFLIISSGLFGFSYLIRDSSILIILPIFAMILFNVIKKNTKIFSFFCFMIPLIFSYFASKYVNELRYIQSNNMENTGISDASNIFIGFLPNLTTLTHMFGFLLSPGIGLFIFSPILLTIFFSFPDFFKKHKSDTLLFSSIFLISLIYFGNFLVTWHGLVSWGPRYLLMVIPFLLIPLGSSLETRNKRFMLILIVTLGILGLFFNISYVTQDVSWFVWGHPGGSSGLYGLGIPNPICDLNCQWKESVFYIHNLVIWTFEYSQLTHSILLMFENLQQDIYLLHLLGPLAYSILSFSCISFLAYLLWKFVKKPTDYESPKL